MSIKKIENWSTVKSSLEYCCRRNQTTTRIFPSPWEGMLMCRNKDIMPGTVNNTIYLPWGMWAWMPPGQSPALRYWQPGHTESSHFSSTPQPHSSHCSTSAKPETHICYNLRHNFQKHISFLRLEMHLLVQHQMQQLWIMNLNHVIQTLSHVNMNKHFESEWWWWLF